MKAGNMLIAMLIACAFVAPSFAEDIRLHSGNGTFEQLDQQITYTESTSGARYPLRWGEFTEVDFRAAREGNHAYVRGHYDSYVWSLPGDPEANWICNESTLARSMLFAQRFTVTTSNITSATMNFTWAADDCLGDPNISQYPDDANFLGHNSAGVYIGWGENPGTPVHLVFDGNCYTVSIASNVDVTSMLHTGDNYLYVYTRDLYGYASGVIYSADITVVPEPMTLSLLALGGVGVLIRRRRGRP